jgi:hypothetical protein
MDLVIARASLYIFSFKGLVQFVIAIYELYLGEILYLSFYKLKLFLEAGFMPDKIAVESITTFLEADLREWNRSV